jgi:hypothetical protein
MKRRPFKRPVLVRQRTVHTPGTGRGVHAPSAGTVVDVPKRVAVRSPALLVACRAIPCQHCFTVDGTVCAAHSNWGEHGKGGRQKADDNRVASLCHRCHSALDQGSRMSGEERRAMWDTAHARTVAALLCTGLWPAAVPVPPEWETVIADGVIVEIRRVTSQWST